MVLKFAANGTASMLEQYLLPNSRNYDILETGSVSIFRYKLRGVGER